MSLFSIKKAADKELDDVFAKSASFATVPTPIAQVPQASTSSSTTAESSKAFKRKADDISQPTDKAELNADGTVKRKAGKKERPPKLSKAEKLEKKKDGKGKISTKAATVGVESMDEDEDEGDNDDTIEQRYAAKTASTPKADASTDAVGTDAGDEDTSDKGASGDEDEDEIADMTVDVDAGKADKKKRRVKKTKYVPEGESSVDRDRRTVFVGNVAVEVLKSKSLQNQLKAHLLSFVPTASIESIRFRSIAFAAPTTQQEDPTAASATAAQEEENRRVQREKERAKAWREENEEEGGDARGGKRRRTAERDDEDNPARDGKVFFKPGEKRKVAFMKGEFHKDVASANAYVVFAHPAPDRPSNVRPIMDPYEAATQVIVQGNNSSFQDRHLRLDAVRPTLDSISKAAAAEGKSTLPARREIWTAGRDVKNSLFVGNLDAAAKEEDLRLFFEALVEKERGSEPKGGQYVLDVRIIRDRETQMAKGFGYVAFNERESVDEVLALPSNKLRHAKRNLRVQPCKTLPSALGGRDIKPVPTKDVKSKNGKPVKPERKVPVKKAAPIVPVVKVHGDPKLGDKIATLSKDERKAFKATDATRLARRAAKKQAAKLKDAMANKRDKVKLDVKGTSKKLSGTRDKSKAKKSRVRSEHAAKKVKGKRD